MYSTSLSMIPRTSAAGSRTPSGSCSGAAGSSRCCSPSATGAASAGAAAGAGGAAFRGAISGLFSRTNWKKSYSGCPELRNPKFGLSACRTCAADQPECHSLFRSRKQRHTTPAEEQGRRARQQGQRETVSRSQGAHPQHDERLAVAPDERGCLGDDGGVTGGGGELPGGLEVRLAAGRRRAVRGSLGKHTSQVNGRKPGAAGKRRTGTSKVGTKGGSSAEGAVGSGGGGGGCAASCCSCSSALPYENPTLA